jgi:hypothetical protein
MKRSGEGRGQGGTARMERTREEIARWRKTRKYPRSAMPSLLWEEAVSLAEEFGIHPIKCALGLNYESLKKRLHGRRPQRRGVGAEGTSFVEVRGADVLGAVAGPVVELTDARGVRLTVRFATESQLDVARLVSAFRGAAS